MVGRNKIKLMSSVADVANDASCMLGGVGGGNGDGDEIVDGSELQWRERYAEALWKRWSDGKHVCNGHRSSGVNMRREDVC